jgi:AsmA protein
LKKSLKILAIAAASLIALFILLVVGLTLFLDPNQFKGRIIETVKAQTGRELRIDGKLGWSFFPWIGIETGKLELGNAPGFGPEPFARLDGAGAKVQLLPLLRKQIVVDTVFLDKLMLNLARNAAGKTNWDDLTKPSKAEEKPAEKPAAGRELGIGGVSIKKIDIRQADVTWSDQSTGAHYAVHNLDLKTGTIGIGQPLDVNLAFDFESGQPAMRTRVSLTSRLAFDPAAQTLDVTALSLSAHDLSLLASLKATHVLEAPEVSGTLELKPFNPRTLMDKLGVKYDSADKKALSTLALKTRFAATGDSAELKDLALTLDDSRLSGTLGIRHFARPAYRFDLAVDRIDLDRYLPAPAPAPTGAKSGAAAAPAPVEIPLSLLRALALQGRLRVQQLTAFNLHSTDAVVQVSADNGLITLGPNQAKLYGGKYAGRTALDVRGKTPLLNIDESVSGIELAPALKDALRFDKFAGTANLGAKLTARGLDANQIKATLSGNADFAVKDGAIKGVNLKKMSDAIAAAIRDKSYQKLTEIVPQAGDETRFTHLSGTAQIKNGVVQNNDLKIQSPDLLNVSGKGSVNLPKETLDYTVILGSYPLGIGCTFAKPCFRPDWNAILKQKLEGKVEQKKEKLEQKLEEKLKDRLKLFR